jgi:ribosomal protein L11 methyltransferase
MIGKLIAYGDTRDQAIRRMRIALSEMVVEGIKTNIPLHQELMHDHRFIKGGTSIHYLEHKLAAKDACWRWAPSRSASKTPTPAPSARTPQFGEPGSTPAPLWAIAASSPCSRRRRHPPDCRRRGRRGRARRHAALRRQRSRRAGLGAADPVQFEPIRINERLWIVPSWHEAPDPKRDQPRTRSRPGLRHRQPPDDAAVPGMAVRHVQPGASVLDYGCGSGILAIAAAKLGGRRVTGVDIDENALLPRPTMPNATALPCSSPFQPSARHVNSTSWSPTSSPIRSACWRPCSPSAPGRADMIALSGILSTQVEQVRQAYRPAFDLAVQAEREGWACWRACEMMLTRCPTCSTAFRVTPEQLKARAGKVRCGHCSAVFNALETLEDAPPAAQMEAEAPLPRNPLRTRRAAALRAFP